jgi:ketosteroid isomerase-like protein
MPTVIAVLLFVLLPFTTLSQVRHSGKDAPQSADSTARLFDRLAQNWREAYNKADSSALVTLYAPDAVYISSHVPGLVTDGRDRVIANFLRGSRMGGHVDTVRIISVQTSCDLATLLCAYEATNGGQKAGGRNLLVLRRVKDGWLIAVHMTVV